MAVIEESLLQIRLTLDQYERRGWNWIVL
jgi:hypothetical protein